MHAVYRREGSRKRTFLWGSLLVLVAAVAVLLGYATVLKVADGISPQEWEDVWGFAALAGLLALAATCFVWELRGAVKRSSLPLIGSTFVLTTGPGWERFSKRRAPALVATAVCLCIALAISVLPLLDLTANGIPPFADKVRGAAWFLVPVPMLTTIFLVWNAIRPATLLIDERGMSLPTASKTRLSWSAIERISVKASPNVGLDPLNDQIAIHLRDGAARLKGRVFWIEPWNRLGTSPTDVLAALDRFRPPTVPIHDPRQIVEESQP